MTCFLPVPVNGRGVSCHDEAVRRYQVPISGRALSCHDEIVLMASKKRRTCASAVSANDSVPGEETVRLPQNLINSKKVEGIDVGVDYESVLALAKALN